MAKQLLSNFSFKNFLSPVSGVCTIAHFIWGVLCQNAGKFGQSNPTFIYLMNFNFLWRALWAQSFTKLVLKILLFFLCRNILSDSSFHYSDKFSNKSLPRHPTIYLLARRGEIQRRKLRKWFFSSNMYVYKIYMNIKCYVTLSYETGLQVKFKINQTWKTVQVHSKSGLRKQQLR